MDNNLLIVVISAFIAVIISYFIANYYFNKRFNEYKKSVDSKFDEYKSLDEALVRVQDKIALVQEELDLGTQALSKVKEETYELQELKKNESKLSENVRQHTALIIRFKDEEANLVSKIETLKNEKNELMGVLDLYSRLDEYTSIGHFEMPDYLYETSARFSEEIKDIRVQQKEMIKLKKAIQYPASVVVVNDKTLNRKILDGQVKLMLIAFNTECDFLIGKVSPSSFSRTLERIESLANTLEKSAATLKCGFNLDYVELKFEECKLQYQYTLKKQEEVDEQKLIKEQIREEQRAIKEYERAIAEAEKEERMYRQGDRTYVQLLSNWSNSFFNYETTNLDTPKY